MYSIVDRFNLLLKVPKSIEVYMKKGLGSSKLAATTSGKHLSVQRLYELTFLVRRAVSLLHFRCLRLF